MSVRSGILAILREGPTHGYGIRTAFNERTGGVWPLNVGQVYTTLERLQRDGLVQSAGQDASGRERWELTPAGDSEVIAWLSSATSKTSTSRDEMAIKIALATSLPSADTLSIVQIERRAALQRLHALSRSLNAQGTPRDARENAGRLVAESLIFRAEAEVRWLDHVLARLRRT